MSFATKFSLYDGGFVVKRKRFSVETITSILKQADLGTPIADLCRTHGVSEQSYYRWKKIYGGWNLQRREN